MSNVKTNENSKVQFRIPLGPNREVRMLEPNDALVLMLIARYPAFVANQEEQILALLSEEGALIAQVLLGTADVSTVPEAVVSTANGLREWVAEAEKAEEILRKKNASSRVKSEPAPGILKRVFA